MMHAIRSPAAAAGRWLPLAAILIFAAISSLRPGEITTIMRTGLTSRVAVRLPIWTPKHGWSRHAARYQRGEPDTHAL